MQARHGTAGNCSACVDSVWRSGLLRRIGCWPPATKRGPTCYLLPLCLPLQLQLLLALRWRLRVSSWRRGLPHRHVTVPSAAAAIGPRRIKVDGTALCTCAVATLDPTARHTIGGSSGGLAGAACRRRVPLSRRYRRNPRQDRPTALCRSCHRSSIHACHQATCGHLPCSSDLVWRLVPGPAAASGAAAGLAWRRRGTVGPPGSPPPR